MKILIMNRDETKEDFEKISDAIIRDLVNMRGMPTDDGQFMRTGVGKLLRNDLNVEICLDVHRVKCSCHDDF